MDAPWKKEARKIKTDLASMGKKDMTDEDSIKKYKNKNCIFRIRISVGTEKNHIK